MFIRRSSYLALPFNVLLGDDFTVREDGDCYFTD